MYITQEEFENFLGIEFEEWDTTPDILINGVESAVNSYIGAENWILVQDYEEKIDVRSVILNADWYNVYLKHWPVLNTTDNPITVNDEAVDNNNNPRFITRGRQLVIKDLECYKNQNNSKENWNWLKIGYTAWYWEYDEATQTYTGIPEDIKLVCLFLCATIFLTRQFVGMTNYRLWDESISLWTQRFMYWSPMVSETLKKYRKVYIAY